jgi:hypothetical protein
VRARLSQFADCRAEFAVEGTTGWRFVVGEIERAGHRATLVRADPRAIAAASGSSSSALRRGASIRSFNFVVYAAPVPTCP